jgi:hypothetical protein
VAWQHFIGGDDEAANSAVPNPILGSWRRCRDVYNLDPARPLAPAQARPTTARYRGAYAHLGGIAAGVVREIGGCIATVTDGHGKILAVWSDERLSRTADDSRLEPQFTWAEAVAGTNGMGMALVHPQIMAVRGPEHWREDMHEWTCLGAAVHDPVTRRPAAALNISSRSEACVTALVRRLREELKTARQHLIQQAARDAIVVAEACDREQRRRSDLVIGLDLGGEIVVGDPMLRRHRGTLDYQLVSLQVIAHEGLEQLATKPDWQGTCALGPPIATAKETFEIRAVGGPDGPAGWMLTRADHAGTAMSAGPAAQSADRAGRIAAEDDHCVLLIDPQEIRFAEARGHVVWLVTDRGRLRSMVRGIDNVERQLSEHGFVRVHRSFVVNPDRVQRVDHKGNGVIALSTDAVHPEDIPVSRRCIHTVRLLLGL